MILAVLVLFFAGFFHFLPRLTRPAMFFSVTVDPCFRSSSTADAITRRYRLTIWSFAVLVFTLLLLTKRQEMALLLVAGYYWATATAHRGALEYAAPAESTVEVNLDAPREPFPGGAYGLLAPLAAYGALALWIYRNWDRLPERLAVHLGPHGVDRWISRTPAALGALLAQDLLLTLLFGAVGFGILHASRRSSNRSTVALEERRFRRANVLAFLLLACFPALQAWIIVLQPAPLGISVIAATLLIVLAYYALLIPNRPRLSAQSGDQTPNRCWKLGIFYFNPGDPALFVVQRFGVGYTFNFGNRWTWAGFATVAAAVSLRAVLR